MNDRVRELARKVLRYAGYPVFFLTFFVLFVYWTFPYDRLKEFLIHQIEAPRPTGAGTVAPSNMEVEIDSLGPTFFPGLRARGVRVTWLPTAAGQRPITARMDSVVVKASLFSLIFGRVNADIEIEGMGGTVEAHIEAVINGPRPGLRKLKLVAKTINAGEIGPLVQGIGLPVQGRMDADVDVTVPDGYINRASGNTQLSVAGLRIGDNVAQFQIPGFGGVTIAQIDAGTLAGTVTIREGVASIERLGARSRELNLALSGRVELHADMAQTGINLLTRFQLTDQFRAKNEQAGRIMMVLDMVPDLRAARGADGMIGLRCRGTVGRGIRCLGDGPGAGDAAGAAGFGSPPRAF
ncbi:MAG: type II secretion system protein GspN [Deltaproteobacteria bacterium]|nr:type II secretion system protein GspN [Deltaproteobacteria bacterium]